MCVVGVCNIYCLWKCTIKQFLSNNIRIQLNDHVIQDMKAKNLPCMSFYFYFFVYLSYTSRRVEMEVFFSWISTQLWYFIQSWKLILSELHFKYKMISVNMKSCETSVLLLNISVFERIIWVIDPLVTTGTFFAWFKVLFWRNPLNE